MLYGKTVIETLDCMERQGGEGVGCGGRNLWYTLSLEKAKMN